MRDFGKFASVEEMTAFFTSKYGLEMGVYGLQLPFTNLYVNFDILENVVSFNINSGFVSSAMGDFKAYELLTLKSPLDSQIPFTYSVISSDYLHKKYDFQNTKFASMLKGVYQKKDLSVNSNPFIYFENLSVPTKDIIDSFIVSHLNFLRRSN